MLGRYLLRRLGQLSLVLWFVTTLLFFLLRVSGDPIVLLAGPSATREDVAALRHNLKLDRPVLVQYLDYLGRAIRFDFGKSFASNRPAMDTVRDRFPNTLKLTVSAFLIALVFGGAAGIIAALKRNSWLSTLTTVAVTFFQGIPSFALGIFLITLFAVDLGWLPSFGDDSWRSLILPSLTLAAFLSARIARLIRSSLVEVLTQDYVRTARAKGLSESSVVLRHALKNGLVPVLTILAVDLGYLMGGAVVTESVFAWPGVGRQVIMSIAARDYAVVQAIVFIIAINVVVVNLAADVAYVWLDPRIKA